MIYLDYAAATPVRREVKTAMDKAENCFANPAANMTAEERQKNYWKTRGKKLDAY